MEGETPSREREGICSMAGGVSRSMMKLPRMNAGASNAGASKVELPVPDIQCGTQSDHFGVVGFTDDAGVSLFSLRA